MNDRVNGAPKGGRRTRTRAEERIEALDTAQAAPTDGAPASPAAPTPPTDGAPAAPSDLLERVAAAEQQAAANETGWQRERADFLNYRRRSEDELARARESAGDGLIRKVLTLADDFDRAIDHIPADQVSSPWVEGIAAIDRKMRQLLESEGVTAIEAVGQPFDPFQHEAVTSEATTEAPDGTVLRELQRGYSIRDRVLRPALVSVASNERTPDHTENQSAEEAQQGRE